MIKEVITTIAAAGLLAVLMSGQQSFAQYPGGAGVGVSDETLKRCDALDIPRTQCDEGTVLQRERIDSALGGDGSGTAIIATETGQMVLFIGVLGAVFGSVAAAFLVKGRGAARVSA